MRAMSEQPKHCVAVIGGAVAGAELAGTLAAAGVEVAVFEQNPRPYGKIEDGLPRWHLALRRKEYESIGEHLSRPNVHFVPKTTTGRDVAFRELVNGWGFTAVVLACGAWRDRPLPVEGADAYVGRGLVYQNPFVIWFNHANEKGYTGEVFEPQDGVLVVGGGLASIDVVKVLMLETARQRLAARDIEVPMLQLEVTEGATPERAEKTMGARRKLLEKAMEKYRFKIEPLCMPEALLVEDGRLAGLRFRRTRADAGKIVPTDETFERRGPYVISSIGSIPLPLDGIPMKGELFDYSDWDLGRLPGYPTVFSAGNVATGKGNIVASRKHAIAVAKAMLGGFLASQPPIDAAKLARLRERVKARQAGVGYGGDYAAWLAEVTPPDLE